MRLLFKCTHTVYTVHSKGIVMQWCFVCASCSCTEVPWAACSRLGLSYGGLVPFDGAENGPSMDFVLEAVSKLESLAESSEAHTQECVDAVKQLLCSGHPCEDRNETALGRPTCGSDCTELLTGRCQDTWAAFLSDVGQGSGAYKKHIEKCAERGSTQECVTLFSPSEPPTTAPVGGCTPTYTMQCMCVHSECLDPVLDKSGRSYSHTTMIASLSSRKLCSAVFYLYE